MPTGIVPVIVVVSVLVIIVGTLDWLIAHPAVLVLIAAAISGSAFLWVRHKRARNRV